MNLDFFLGYFKDSLNIFFLEKIKKIISLNILIITCSNQSRLGWHNRQTQVAWVWQACEIQAQVWHGPGTWVWQTIPDPRCVGLALGLAAMPDPRCLGLKIMHDLTNNR